MEEENSAVHEEASKDAPGAHEGHRGIKARLAKAVKSLTWEDYLFAGIVLFFMIGLGTIISQFVQLPGPLYGGDYYNHFGEMLHIAQGGSIFDSGQMLGVESWTPWLYHVMVVALSRITGLSLLHANLYIAVLLMPIAAIIMYLMAQLLFKNKLIALIPTIFLLYSQPMFKYTPFAFYLLCPLYFLLIYKLVQTRSFKYAIASGVVYGLIGLTHTVVFMAMSLYSALVALYFLATQARLANGKLLFNKPGLKRYFLLFLVVLAIGAPIAMLYWYGPIFVHHAKVLNPIQEVGFYDVTTLGGQLTYIFSQIKWDFFYFPNLRTSIMSIFTVLGLLFLIFLKKKTFAAKMILLSVAIAVIGFSHILITEPLAHTHVFPAYFNEAIFVFWSYILMTFAVAVLYGMLSKLKVPKIVPKIFLLAIIALLVINGVYNLKVFDNDQWTQVGKQPLQPYMQDMSAWVMQNTGLNDVFLSTNENSFALNALTGRKILTNRITHSSSYVDMDQRMMDAAIILYGNNEDLRTQLIEKYHVKYLYWEYNWINMEFSFNQDGQFQGLFDPYMVLDTPEHRQYLSENGVNFTLVHTWRDPAYHNPLAPQYDVIVVLPSQFNPVQPWSDELQARLALVQEFNQSGQTAARIYAISGNPAGQ